MSSSEVGPLLVLPRLDSDSAPLGRFISVAVVASVVYTLLSTGSMGGCVGGVSVDGGYVDSSGLPTGSVPVWVIGASATTSYCRS